MTTRLAAFPAAFLVLVLGLVLRFVLAPTAWAQPAPRTLFTLDDPRLDEVSGIARGMASPNVYYVQNDSGDAARFFALDARNGRVRAVYTVPGAQNHDWEDIAVAPDSRGVPSIWLADMGDNEAQRSSVQLYRVDEPHVDLTRYDVAARSTRPQVWQLRYPSGPANAESLAVTPSGRAYVITKASDGRSGVFAVPRRPDPTRIEAMTRIATVTFHAQPSLIPPSLQVLATGAALSADGSLLVVRTYTDAYFWRVRSGDVAAAVRRAPVRVSLPLQPQGEGVCFVGASVVIDSEHVGSAVLSIALPDSVTPSAGSSRIASASSAATAGSSSASESRGHSSAPASATATSRSDAATGSSRPSPAWAIGLGVAAVALGVVGLGYVRRRGRRG